MKKKFLLSLFALTALTGCNSTNLSTNSSIELVSHRLTLGDVQRSIKIGMSSADVIEILDSPNVVTTNDDGSESWVYDKMSSEMSYSNSSFSSITSNGNNGFSTRSNRSLIIFLKFNKKNKVERVEYRQTSY